MILIIDTNPKKDSLGFDEFVSPLVSLAGGHGNCKVIHYSELDHGVASDSERIIISGSPLGETGYLNDMKRFQWLMDYDKPVLGICSGMQILGILFGSHKEQCQEIGMTRIRTMEKNPLFSGDFMSYELHMYAIEPSGNLEVLAMSDKCVQAIRVRDKPFYGTMFHPEVRNKEIVKNFIRI